MVAVDYYKVLDIPKNSSDIEIRKAFRKQALKFHPDRNKEVYAKKQFQQVNEAFEILSDKTKRHQYDLQTTCTFDASYAEALFTQFFSDHLPPSPPQPRSIKRTLPISLEDMYTGTTKKLKITLDNTPTVLTLVVKPGVKNGTTYTFFQNNHEIHLELQQKPHDTFIRQGDHLFTTMTLTLLEALTGFKKSIPTLDGQCIYICSQKRVIQSGQQQVLAGQGMPTDCTGKKGDLVIQFHVELPQTLSVEQCHAIEQILYPTK